jgi:hypothetical protein
MIKPIENNSSLITEQKSIDKFELGGGILGFSRIQFFQHTSQKKNKIITPRSNCKKIRFEKINFYLQPTLKFNKSTFKITVNFNRSILL